jgi:succinate dehydrogenase/fumarate reductase-like Fe-S protein
MSDGGRARRITDGTREPTFTFIVDGVAVEACAGETIGGALLLAGHRPIRHTARGNEARGLYCVMGVCWECAVRVDGQTVRACVVPAAPGLVVETLRGMSP